MRVVVSVCLLSCVACLACIEQNLEDGQTRLGCVEEEKNELLLQLQEFKEQLEKAAIVSWSFLC